MSGSSALQRRVIATGEVAIGGELVTWWRAADRLEGEERVGLPCVELHAGAHAVVLRRRRRRTHA